jgi:hypothetical protein
LVDVASEKDKKKVLSAEAAENNQFSFWLKGLSA